MAILTRAIKVVQKIQDVINEPETKLKGKEFEDFTRSHLFTKNDYECLERTPNYIQNDYIESLKKPDFKFRSRKRGKEFFVEAKYRSVLNRGSFEFKPDQLSRYKDYNKETPVYIVIGVGRQPQAPQKVFLIPIKDISIKFDKLSRSFLNKHQIPLESMYERRKAIETIIGSL
jgi:hypothetical protein